MTTRELFEEMEKRGFADEQLYILVENNEVDYITSWDTDKIIGFFTCSGKLYLDHEFDSD